MHPPPKGPLAQVPQVLRALPRWIAWTLRANAHGRLSKIPDASTNDRARWRTHEQALRDAGEITPRAGVGFVFTGGVDVDGGRLFALDLDGCRDPQTGSIEPWASAVIDAHARSYTEVTPSGTGLRVWTLVAAYPAKLRRAKVNPPHDAAPNVPEHKRVELQVFGYGPAQFVTVTGNHLPGTSTAIERVPNLRWLLDAYGLEGKDADAAKQALPSGSGPPPTPEELTAALRASPQASAIFDANWRPILAKSDDAGKSASEAYWRVVQTVLRAAKGHGNATLRFLLDQTAWGRGEVEESADPSKYARAAWVAKEIARVAEKTPPVVTADVFDVEPVPEPPSTAPAEGKPGLLIRADAFLRASNEDAFLVYGVLPRCGLAHFYGDPGGGKTPFALSLAVHVAAAKATWFGHEIDSPGSVVYMIGEDATGIRNRLRAELAMHGVDAAGLPLHFTTRPGSLTEKEDAAVWYSAIRAVAPGRLALLVVDTQARNFGPANENASEDMGRFVAHLQALADRLGALVLLVHHTGHQNKDRARGSSVLFGALDASFEITREGKASVQARPTKMKNAADPAPLRGTLEVRTVGVDRKGRPVTAVCLRDAPLAPAEVLAEFQGDDDLLRLLGAVATLAAKGTPGSMRALADALGAPRTRALDAQAERAVGLGLLAVGSETARGGTRKTYGLTELGAGVMKKAAEKSEGTPCQFGASSEADRRNPLGGKDIKWRSEKEELCAAKLLE